MKYECNYMIIYYSKDGKISYDNDSYVVNKNGGNNGNDSWGIWVVYVGIG